MQKRRRLQSHKNFMTAYEISVFKERVPFHPGEHEFHQAVREVITSLWDFLEVNPEYLEGDILERILEPERVVISILGPLEV